MNRKGLTLISMVIYVTLFFAFMTFAVGVSANMNYTSLSQKGQVMNVENFQKLQYNMLNSAKSSISVDKIGNSIVFSNNDEYFFDSEKKIIFKNNTVLVSDVIGVETLELYQLSSVPSTYLQQRASDLKYVNIDDSKQYVCLNVTFEKYGIKTNSQLFITVGDGVSNYE